ncbi:beta-lactamase family protein [Crocinitomicaceae bacterium]|nr:beta-lactamase family protein [Crocinitomicaceae bacterium]
MMRFFGILLFVLLSATSIGQDRFKLMNQYFDSVVKYDEGMGSIAIFEDGKEQFRRIYGYADKAKKKKANKKTKYRIGSISKTFTAVCIMQMVDEGRIKLDQKLAVFYPDLPNADKISIEQLLRHRSGLHNFLDDDDYTDYLKEEQSRAAHMKRFIEKGVDFEPGEKYSYSNTNYVLLAFICEDVDRKSFSEILSKRITKPLKLKNTQHTGGYNLKNKEALSYYWSGEWQNGWQTHGSVSIGAGSLISTVSDLNRFFCALENEKLVSAPAYEKMKTMVEGYGLGLFSIPWKEDVGYGHTGGIDGFQSVLAYFPEHKVYIAFCGNGIKLARNEIVLTALGMYFKETTVIPDLSSKESLLIKDVMQYVGKYKSADIDLEIEISGSNGVLSAQATGQSIFPLTAEDENTFIFKPAGITMRFDLNTSSFILEQGGGKFVFQKK